jgi:cob(I)alamin adenosyltransferase
MIGVLIAFMPPSDHRTLLLSIQGDLEKLRRNILNSDAQLLAEDDVARLRQALEPLAPYASSMEVEFAPPSKASSFALLAREICRRAERRLISLSELDSLEYSAHGLVYLDLLAALLLRLAEDLSHVPDFPSSA